MQISVIYLYDRIASEIAFSEYLIDRLKTDNELHVVTGKNFPDSFMCGIQAKKVWSDSLPVNKIDKKKTVSLLNAIHAELSAGNLGKSVIVPLHNWELLKNIKQSYLQLSAKHVLFCVDNVATKDMQEFIKLVEYLDRFRNIHVGIYEDVADAEKISKIYNLHLLQQENLEDILVLHLNNRRKYIGWRYHLNELRQKIKFHKDLIKHWLKNKFSKKYKQKFSGEGYIPKVIHYCWFGNPNMPESVKKFVDSWEKALPGYTIKLWNENNFPIEKYRFAQEALANKKWAFIADIARLHALYYEGGIYLDTDVEVLKNFDDFLQEDAFATYGPCNHICISTVGAKKFHPWIAELLLWYDCVHCDEDYTEIANAKIVSKITRIHYGVKLDGGHTYLSCEGVHVYPKEYFSPELEKDHYLVTGKTHCVHHFSGLW
ncbi:glycosyltransferase [uncultured Phascolarctobacterium sp.]|uniref:glycosyltransferase family 32 protein n=1 Tax=uncultured Phascolarctobacterium sp. TaxID=512296 RepID=UPI0025F2E516|nr:glycosyltransferase [uncultured Phascolarctobacterium sp.]